MRGRAQIGTTRDMLLRIVALLFSMADLAERAAGAPRPVRCLVLWALSRADAVAREFVVDTASSGGRPWSPAILSMRYGFEPADAMNLAASLRTLAFVVEAMVEPLFGPAFADCAPWAWGDIRPDNLAQAAAAALGCGVDAMSAPRLDTS